MKNQGKKKFLVIPPMLYTTLLIVFIVAGAINAVAQAPSEKLVKSSEELSAAFAKAMSGDVIVMQDGTWKDINILVKGNGTKEKPITLKAQTPGKVIVSGKSSLRLSGRYLVVDGLHFKDGYSSTGALIRFINGKEPAHYSRITNIVVAKFNRPKEDGSDIWISLSGTHNRVDHSFFYEKISAGKLITVSRPTDSADYHQIDHNYFKDIPVLGKNGAEVVGVGWSGSSMSDSHTVIEYNLLENCNGEGELFGLKSGRNIIRHNTIFRSQGSISLRHGNNNLVEGNFVFADRVPRTGGIRIMGGEGHIVKNNYVQGVRGARPALAIVEGMENSPIHGYLQIKDILVEGNTLVDNDVNIVVGYLYNPAKKYIMKVMNSTIKNNVIVGTGKSQLIEVLDEPVNMTYQGNVVYNGLLSVEQAGVKKEDPKLKAVDGVYYYPKGSPFKGNIIGKPLKRTEVGPSWIKGMWEELGIKDIPYVSN